MVPDLDEVAQGVIGLVCVGLMAMVALHCGHGFQTNGAFQAPGQREPPGAAPVRVARRPR
jgi:hypothetical protein